MATYIQGLTDYIPEIQPFQPDYNFYANVMQTRQTRYDDAKKQINDLYGSLLYADMTNPENIKKRENYFKVIDQDIKKISGLDLSLQQNVDQAVNVFKGFHDDKYMPTDMAWTRKYKDAVSKHEILKNCTDPKKCGDMIAWNEGLQELEYKREAFAKADLESTLKMEAPSYTPYFNWKPGVMKYVKDQGISIAKDKSNGKFIVRNKNGELIKDGIETLLHTVYGDDPRISANNYTKAFVTRKNTIRSNAAIYGSEEEAEKMYMQNTMQNGIKVLRTDLNTLNDGYDQLNAIQTKLENKKKMYGALTKAEEKQYQEAVQQKQLVENTKNSYQSQLADIEHNMKDADLNALNRKTDLAQAALYFNDDVKKMAESLSHIDEEVNTIQKVDPDYEQRLKKDLAKYENDLGMIRDAVQSELKKDETYYAAFFKERKKGKEEPTITPSESITVEAVPGGTTKQIEDYGDSDKLDEFFTKRATTLLSTAKNAGSVESTQALWNMFKAAKTDQGAGAKKYLNQLYGAKWKEVNTKEQFAALTASGMGSKDAFILMHESKKFIQDEKNDVDGWGTESLSESTSLIAQANIKKFGANSEIDYFKNGVKSVLNNMSATKEYKYAKYLPNKNGQILFSDKVTPEFIKAFMTDNASAGVDDVLDAYNETKKAFYREYVKADQTSIDQAKPGSGMKTGRGKMMTVDSGETNNAFNNAVIKATDKGFANEGAYKVFIGNASKDNYDDNEESNPLAKGFISDFTTKIRNKTIKDEKRPKYRMLAQGVAADDDTKSSFTIYPTKEQVDEYFGSDKKTEESGVKQEIMEKGISFVYDNTKINTPIDEYLKISPIEKQLLAKGSYKIGEFAKTAGSIDLFYDDETGKTTIKPTYMQADDSEYGYTPIPFKPVIINDIKQVQASVDQYILNLQALQDENFKTQERIRLANKSKTQK